jgi:hypothetical protein
MESFFRSVRAWNCRVTRRKSHYFRKAASVENLEPKTLLTASLSLPTSPVDINEDLQDGSQVATFTYTGDFSWLYDDPSGSFSVMDDGMGSGQMILDSSMGIDYESLSPSNPSDPSSDRLIQLTIEVMDLMIMTFAQATMNVRVNDVAEDPYFGSPAPDPDWFFNVSEVAVVGHIVGQIPVFDPQPNTYLTFNVYEGDITDQATWVTSSGRDRGSSMLWWSRVGFVIG